MILKIKLVLLLFVLCLEGFGQEKRKDDTNKNNAKIAVIYSDSDTKSIRKNKPVYIIDGHLFENESVLTTLLPDTVETITVEKKEFKVKNKVYYGKIYINTKADYTPNFTTIKALINKHLKLEDELLVFQIDAQVINLESENYIVDENSILKIEVSNIRVTGLTSEIKLIKIITKKASSDLKTNSIQIRGLEM
ncbi:hypothetical protein [Formosa sp. A9]|uniref:hypothetical protein n=1 Tax=Formosa sp. A9 TaxID=3442641 RepID=UPI003EBB3EF2